MGKMFKPLVVIVLLLSIVALVLQFLLFNQREVLKARTQKMERAATGVATAIKYDDFKASALMVKDKASLPAMDGPLNQLVQAAESKQEDLVNTKDTLATTKDNLRSTVAELQSTQTTLATTEQTLESTATQLSETQNNVAQLEDEVAEKKSDIDDLQADIDEFEETLEEKESDLTYKTERIAQLEEEIRVRDEGTVQSDLIANVLSVNPEWNYLILDKGKSDQVLEGANMLIHRDGSLIGKCVVSEVQEDMAVASILLDWKEAEIMEGDNVIF